MAWIALIAIGLHGLIPVGYMPDFSGHGLFVMCDGTDHAAAHTGAMDNCPHHKKICPFSVAVIDGFKGLLAPAVLPPVYGVSDDFSLPSLLQRPAREFANASQRSPPSFS